MTEPRDLDVVLLGATGFTGRLVAEHLDRRLSGSELRWAIAGRNPDKLAELASGLASRPTTEVVDVDDLVGLLDLAGRTRVLGTTVGPFARHGELVAQACVRSATHYADITGEPAFVATLRTRYHRDARGRGVRIVNCCGFDSVPHDLGVRFTVAHLPDDEPLTVAGYVRAEGRLSGGTAVSAIEAIAAGGGHRVGEIGDEPPIRTATSLPVRLHRIDELDGWGVPLPTIDPQVVLRSARVSPGYGTQFRYGHYARVHRLPTVVAGVGVVGIAAAMASTAPTRALLGWVLPSQGDGPDERTRRRSRFEVTFVGRGVDTEVVTRVSGGDPGYGETAKMLGEALLSLAEDDGPGVAGVLTPAVALGQPYHERLVANGIGFEVLER